MTVLNYVEDDYINRKSFEKEVKRIIKNIYDTPFDVDVTFNNCMAYGYAVVLPVSDKYPKGMIMATDIYRTEVAFLV